MFLDEARLAARIHHPNVVPILEIGADRERVLPRDGVHRGRHGRRTSWRARRSGPKVPRAHRHPHHPRHAHGPARRARASATTRGTRWSSCTATCRRRTSWSASTACARITDFGIARRGTPRERDAERSAQGQARVHGARAGARERRWIAAPTCSPGHLLWEMLDRPAPLQGRGRGGDALQGRRGGGAAHPRLRARRAARGRGGRAPRARATSPAKIRQRRRLRRGARAGGADVQPRRYSAHGRRVRERDDWSRHLAAARNRARLAWTKRRVQERRARQARPLGGAHAAHRHPRAPTRRSAVVARGRRSRHGDARGRSRRRPRYLEATRVAPKVDPSSSGPFAPPPNAGPLMSVGQDPRAAHMSLATSPEFMPRGAFPPTQPAFAPVHASGPNPPAPVAYPWAAVPVQAPPPKRGLPVWALLIPAIIIIGGAVFLGLHQAQAPHGAPPKSSATITAPSVQAPPPLTPTTVISTATTTTFAEPPPTTAATLTAQATAQPQATIDTTEPTPRPTATSRPRPHPTAASTSTSAVVVDSKEFGGRK